MSSDGLESPDVGSAYVESHDMGRAEIEIAGGRMVQVRRLVKVSLVAHLLNDYRKH